MGSSNDPNLVPPVVSSSAPVVISATVMAARAYRIVTAAHELDGLGFTSKQRKRLPALLIPVYDVLGRVRTHVMRPHATSVGGLRVEYEMPHDARLVLDVPPAVGDEVLNSTKPLLITSDIIDADAAASHGLCALALLGLEIDEVVNEATLWEGIPLAERSVYVALSSDIDYRVFGVSRAVKNSLSQHGARVQFIQIPSGNLGEKMGIANFFGKGGTVNKLLALATKTHVRPTANLPTIYSLGSEGTVWHKGETSTLLANFTARIVRETLLDDGIEKTRIYDIEAYVGNATTSVQIPADQFNRMTWPSKYLGAQAIVSAQYNALPHLRFAIQSASGDVPCHHVYRHTGWVNTSEHGPIYLHAKGAIGMQGDVPGVEVQLEGEMALYEFPTPPPTEVLRERVLASLDITRHIAERVSIPILAATYRVVLGDIDASVFVSGPTGTGKSEMSALAQQHFGAKMDARHLPASWSSTPNALEDLAFMAKDTMLVIDDFVTTDPQHAVRLHHAADRVLRAQGNRSGRGRLRNDGTRQQARPPRGLILSNGEDTPRGQSLNARFLHVSVEKDDVRWETLADCQTRAAAGEFAEAMAGFIIWLASRKDELNIVTRRSKLRDEVMASHRRSADTAANIAVGWQVWLEYAVDIGALTTAEGELLWTQGWRIIRDVAEGQRALQVAQEPARRFVELLRAAISSGRAHLTDPTGEPPVNAIAWGWRQLVYNTSSGMLQPQGTHIGWVDGQDLYLEPESAFKVAQQMSQGGSPFSITILTLKQRLFQENWLADAEREREVYTVRRTLHDVRFDVLYLHVFKFRGDMAGAPQIVSGVNQHPTNPTPLSHGSLVGLVGPGNVEMKNIADDSASDINSANSKGFSGPVLPPDGDVPDDA